MYLRLALLTFALTTFYGVSEGIVRAFNEDRSVLGSVWTFVLSIWKWQFIWLAGATAITLGLAISPDKEMREKVRHS